MTFGEEPRAAGSGASAPPTTLRVGPGLLVRGTEFFCQRVRAVLGKVKETPTGSKLLEELAATEKNVTIEETEDRNAYCVPRDPVTAVAAGRPLSASPDSPGFKAFGRGGGSDSTVLFNPDVSLPNKLAPGSPMPPEAALVHTLTLALLYGLGTSRAGEASPDGWDTRDARKAIEDGDLCESCYLRDIRFRYKRSSHRTDFVIDPQGTDAP